MILLLRTHQVVQLVAVDEQKRSWLFAPSVVPPAQCCHSKRMHDQLQWVFSASGCNYLWNVSTRPCLCQIVRGYSAELVGSVLRLINACLRWSRDKSVAFL